MSTTSARARRLELEGAERRVGELLRAPSSTQSPVRRVGVLVVAVALFAAAFTARLVISDPGALLANFYVVPIALLAIEFGTRAGLMAAACAFALVPLWSVIESVHVTPLGYVSRGAVFVVTGAVVGRFAERLRDDIAERQRAQRHLSLYADELERANRHLSRSVERLEAFAEIARAVGGETDLERVLSLILAHGKEIVAARRLAVYLPEGDELAVISTDHRGGFEPRLPLRESPAGQVLLSGQPRRVSSASDRRQLEQLTAGAETAILVPMLFRGQSLGVLAAIAGADGRSFEDEDEELLMSVAASAATAVATARSVAEARLRLSVEAADEARARWARELHDATLQGLTGARMVLSAGLAHGDPRSLRQAAQAADAHLGEEVRSLRDLIAELRPAALDDLGLGPAIESLAKRQAAIGGFTVEAGVSVGGGGERLGRETENAIYRIVQEALNNAVKHARARRVSLRVDRLPDQVEISVEDDGGGFDPTRTKEGLGITGMRERAALQGGHLVVRSAGGGPTCVSAVLPLRPSSNGGGRDLRLG